MDQDLAKFKIDNHYLTYRDQGSGPVLLLVHGTPTSSHEYREVIDRLCERFRCIAIDHLGFGSSDKPKKADYSISAHRRRLAGLLEHLKINRFHLLVHDFGGPIALPLALPTQTITGREFTVESLTILNSWCWPLNQTEPQMKSQAWMVSSGLLPFAYRYFNFSPRVLFKLGWGKHTRLQKATHDFYIGQFPTPSQRSGTLAFLLALFDFELPEWQVYKHFHELKVTPIQIVWGEADKLVSMQSLNRWKQELPQAQVHILKDVGHFIAEEAPSELAEYLIAFISETNAR